MEAHGAALALVELEAGGALHAQQLQLLVGGGVGPAAVGTDLPHQTLGDDALQGAGGEVGLHADVKQAVQRGRRVAGMNRGEDQVAGDGGPHGDLIGQIVQDYVFIKLTKSYSKNFQNEYEDIFLNLFEDIQQTLINQDVKLIDEYDPILSGISITIIVVKSDCIYSANVGNVLALVVHNDTATPTKNEIDILTIDDSDLYNDNFEKLNKLSTEDFDIINIHGLFDMNDELRRIYENGGEIRQIGGEEKGRIISKHSEIAYFPIMAFRLNSTLSNI